MEKGPGRNCSPWSEAHTEAGFPTGIIALGGLTMEQSIHKDCTPWKGARRGEKMEEEQEEEETQIFFRSFCKSITVRNTF